MTFDLTGVATADTSISASQMSLARPGEATARKEPARVHLTYLDGVRGLAALIVLVNHASGDLAGSLAKGSVGAKIVQWLLHLLSGGHYAVDAFIVLSGFCLMIPVARRGGLEGGAGRFFLRRARRILPPYYACAAIMLLYTAAVLYLGGHAQPLPSVKTLLLNVVLLEDWVPGTNAVNGVFWSVAAEWKIYFLLPCFVLLWRRSPRLMLATAMLIGLGLIPLLHLAFPANNLSRACPWYVALFAMGLAAAGLIFSNHGTVTKARAGAMLGIGALVFGLAAACFCTLFPPVRALSNLGTEVDWRMPVADLLVGAAVAGVLGWLAASVLAGRRNLLLRFFEFTPLVWLGMIGYSLYLMHPLALNFMVAIVHRVASGAQAQAILLFVGGVPAAVFFSYLFYLCVERQFLNSVPVRKPSTVKSPSLILQVPSETAPGNVA